MIYYMMTLLALNMYKTNLPSLIRDIFRRVNNMIISYPFSNFAIPRHPFVFSAQLPFARIQIYSV